MYQNLKLEKGLYHLTNKSFVQALEALDPSAQYADTPLAGLDAYERQLKRFDIRISGAQCDRVEKFFTSTESAVLFPEFVRRAVQQGIDASMLSDLTAVETHTDSSQYLGCTITETDAYGTVAQGAAMTSSTILEATTALTLNKYGRLVKASYEAVRRQRLDVFAVLLKSVGMQLGQALMQQAITTLTTTVGSTTAKAGSALAYSDLATLYGKFSTYDMNLLLVSPKNAAAILAMSEMEDVVPVEQGHMDANTFITYCPSLKVLDSDDEDEFRLVQKKINFRATDGHLLTLEEMPTPCHRLPRSYINDILMQYAGITIEDMHSDWKSNLCYVPETDCFYTFTSDFGPGAFNPSYGEKSGAIVTLWGASSCNEGPAVLTLQKNGNGWLIRSFQAI